MEIKIEKTKIPEVIKITSPSWDGIILKMPRDKYNEWKKKGEQFKTASIYAIYADHFDRITHGNDLYIGQSGDIQQRIDQHCASKDFWSVVLIFTSKDDWMNIAHTKSIECKFIELAKTANRYNVLNGNDGAYTHLGTYDSEKIDEYIKPIIEMLSMIGVDIFEINTDGLYINEKIVRPKLVLKSTIRILDLQNRTVELLSGSELFDMRIDKTKSLQGVENYEDYRLRVIENIQISLGDDYLPKIYGNSIRNWKSKTGVSLYECFKSYKDRTVQGMQDDGVDTENNERI